MVHRESLDDHVFRQVHFWNFSRSDCKFARKKIDAPDGTSMEVTECLREIIRISWNAITNPASCSLPKNRPLPKFYDMVVVFAVVKIVSLNV